MNSIVRSCCAGAGWQAAPCDIFSARGALTSKRVVISQRTKTPCSRSACSASREAHHLTTLDSDRELKKYQPSLIEYRRARRARDLVTSVS